MGVYTDTVPLLYNMHRILVLLYVVGVALVPLSGRNCCLRQQARSFFFSFGPRAKQFLPRVFYAGGKKRKKAPFRFRRTAKKIKRKSSGCRGYTIHRIFWAPASPTWGYVGGGRPAAALRGTVLRATRMPLLFRCASLLAASVTQQTPGP